MTLPETTPSEPTTPPESDFQEKLRELTAQSWNLELIVSGAALFATLSLPDLMDNLFTYYRYNLMTDTDYIHEALPSQALGLIKGVCYILFGAFLANFVMRAFWIGLVGLLAAYPKGIQYDRIYRLSNYSQKRLANEMGSLPDYIIRLDRRCNVVFALAFSLVLLFLSVAAAYILFILIETGLQLLLPDSIYETVRTVVGWTLGLIVIGLAVVVTILNTGRFRDNERYASLVFRLTEGFSILFLGMYRPLLYIVYTFYSQIPEKTLKKRLVSVMCVLFAAEMGFMIYQVLYTQNATDLLDARSYMTMRAPTRTANANSFDNLRSPDQLIDKVSIQSDIIREPYLRLFISYPKVLDTELAKRFKEPNWPDSLSRKERREQKAAWYLKSMESYFRVYLNDSLYNSPGLLFTKRADNGQLGLTTVLLTKNLKEGRNMLNVMVPDSVNKPQPYHQIPFWYIPEN
jgi:hypothetical protein